MYNSNKNAFTLAETLITLMIIGVVAAVTIPSMLTEIREHQYKSVYKKSLSTLSNGVKNLAANEIECEVGNNAQLAQCMAKAIRGTLTDYKGNTSGEYTKNVLVATDGIAYAFYYKSDDENAQDSSISRPMAEICGEYFGSTENDYNGVNAKCIVAIDLNGLSKGNTQFQEDNENSWKAAGSKIEKGAGKLINGEEQLAVILTANGAKPIFVKGSKDGTNKGYEYIYGLGASPFGDDIANNNNLDYSYNSEYNNSDYSDWSSDYSSNNSPDWSSDYSPNNSPDYSSDYSSDERMIDSIWNEEDGYGAHEWGYKNGKEQVEIHDKYSDVIANVEYNSSKCYIKDATSQDSYSKAKHYCQKNGFSDVNIVNETSYNDYNDSNISDDSYSSYSSYDSYYYDSSSY